MGISRARFLAAAGAAAVAPIVAAAPAHAGGRQRPIRRGVCYAVGDGDVPGTGWMAARMRSDLRSISRDLHANAVSVYGTGPERLAATAAEAAGHGLSVWLQPRQGDVPPADIIDHLAETGRHAERLRRGGARVVLSVGCEFVLFVPGIVPGADVLERVRNLQSGNFDPVVMQRRLAAFTARAARMGRSVFRGPLTYGASYDETVDWSLFDIISANYYGDRPRRDLAPHLRLGKPLAVTEFGCCTYEGAAANGGMGWDVVDYTREPPQIAGNLVRSEQDQARYLTDRLSDFASMDLPAAFVYDFVSPGAPHRRNPRYDLDLASYSIVRTIWADDTDPANGWRWEPKVAFDALARQFARLPVASAAE
ncbi:hypothetical protein Val02_74610 [Virgisporangium aliadipatigenens]|uniref:Abortive phage infection protein n=1 Tax=Virgisporangium aliadipatigenens TaxID=741659 RepID=A0A8J4DTT8_9ACTN|nr:hypothetical protein [Virgisporangium aliadipatigenens]GIJ50575.1 hypothetical protein Val02_74610 [Virgisporangium aliadipatigenens]